MAPKNFLDLDLIETNSSTILSYSELLPKLGGLLSHLLLWSHHQLLRILHCSKKQWILSSVDHNNLSCFLWWKCYTTSTSLSKISDLQTCVLSLCVPMLLSSFLYGGRIHHNKVAIVFQPCQETLCVGVCPLSPCWTSRSGRTHDPRQGWGVVHLVDPAFDLWASLADQ